MTCPVTTHPNSSRENIAARVPQAAPMGSQIRSLITWLAGLFIFAAASGTAFAELSKKVELYKWVDFSFHAPGVAKGASKWDVQGSCKWTHESGATRTSLVWFSGQGDTYVFRFGASLPGKWKGETQSPASRLNGHSLAVEVTPSSNSRRTGWSGQMKEEPNAWARQQGPKGALAKQTPILIMMPDVPHWQGDHSIMRAFVREFGDQHGFNGGHISTVGGAWFDAASPSKLSMSPPEPDVRTFAALEAAAAEWAERGGWLHIWMWGKGETGDFDNLPGGYSGEQSKRLNRYLAARLGPVAGWSLGLGWDVEFWVSQEKLKWWLDDLIPQFGGWHHWVGHRYSDSDIGQGHDPEPANKGEYLARGIAWNTLRPANEQYAGWEHWATMTTDAEIDEARRVFPDRSLMSEDRFRQRQGAWRQKDLRSDDDVLKEIPRWASRGVAAIYGRLLIQGTQGSEPWPNKSAIKEAIQNLERQELDRSGNRSLP